LGEGDIDVVGPGQVPGGPDKGIVVEDVEDSGNGDEHVIVCDLDLLVGDPALTRALGAALLAVAVAVAASPTPVARPVVIEVVAATLGLLALAWLLTAADRRHSGIVCS